MAGRADIQAGKSFVTLYVKRDRFTRGLRDARRSLNDFGSSMLTLGATVAGVGAGMLAPFAMAIGAASDFEEAISKFNTVFGDSAKEIKAWSDGFAAEVGRSKTQIVQFMAGTQDLLVPIGFEPGAAENLSKQITGLAIDLASFNNMADADVMRDLHAALTGSGEVMKKYGVVVKHPCRNLSVKLARMLHAWCDGTPIY